MNPPGPAALRAVDEALANAGVQESPRGSNWGDAVKSYLAAVNIHFPAAWCLAFIVFRLIQAAHELGINIPSSFPRSGYCPTLGNWARVTGNRVAWKDAKRGDILLIWHADLKRLAHATLLTKDYDGQAFHTVEGNTNTDGSREGYEVAVRTRNLDSLDPRSMVVRVPW